VMTPAEVAAGVWESARSTGTDPKVFELADCDCVGGSHPCHIVGVSRPVSVAHVVSTVAALVAGPGVTGLAVWSETTSPAGCPMLLVVGSGDAVAMVGSTHPSSRPRVLQAMAGPLYTACLAALTPVPADDPLVVELASLVKEGN